MPQSDRAALARRLATGAIALLLVLATGYALRDTLTLGTLSDNRHALLEWRNSNYALAVIGYMTAYVAVVALSLPGATVLTLTGGFLFGLFPGVLFAVLAATLGATLLFLLAKAGVGDALHRRIVEGNGGRLQRLEAGLQRNAFSYLLTLRLVPGFPFFLVNLAPAFFGISTRTFVLTTFLGIIPGTAIYTWVGAGLGELLARGETPDLGIVFDPMILGPLLGLGTLALLPVFLRWFRAGRTTE